MFATHDEELNRLVSSLPGSERDSVDKISLMCLGLLWCSGEIEEKAEVLLEMINPPG